MGNIAATIQAPNLSITSGGQIQNIGNVIGTEVSLTGVKLINGITTANTYTPRVNAPSQVISLTPLTMPGLNLGVPRAVGKMPAAPSLMRGNAQHWPASRRCSAEDSVRWSGLMHRLRPWRLKTRR
nr:hypothetical protein [Cupriavidus gilardii]